MHYYRLLQIEPTTYAIDYRKPRPCSVEFKLENALESALLMGGRVETDHLLGECDKGVLLDYPFTIPSIHLVSDRLRKQFERLVSTSVQFLSTDISGLCSSDNRERDYWIVHFLDTLECVDRAASEKAIYSRENLPTWAKYPQKLGQFRNFEGLVLSREKVSEHAVFRVAEWPMAIVVNSDFVSGVSEEQLTGLSFEEVNVTN